MSLFGERILIIWYYFSFKNEIVLFFLEKQIRYINLICGLLVFNKLLFKAAHQNIIIPVILCVLRFSLLFCSFVCYIGHQRQVLNFKEN